MAEQATTTTTRRAGAAVGSLTAAQAARRRRIVRVGLELLEAGTYETVQVRDVALAADVALGTVYRYFPSKEHLFAAVLLDWSESFGTRVRREPAPGATDAERLVAALHRALAAFEHRPQFFKLVTVLQVAADPEVVGLYREFTSGTQAVLAETLRDVPPSQVDDVVGLVGAVLDSVLRAWSHGQMTVDEARQRLTRSVELVFSPPPRRRRRS